jgi:hypothetical protein
MNTQADKFGNSQIGATLVGVLASIALLATSIIIARASCGPCGYPYGDFHYTNPCSTPNCNSSNNCGGVSLPPGYSKYCNFNCVNTSSCLTTEIVVANATWLGGYCATDCGCIITVSTTAPWTGTVTYTGPQCF